MKKMVKTIVLSVCAGVLIGNGAAVAQVSEEVLKSIHTPNEVKTSVGKLKFIDGAPLPETADKVYQYLDTARAMDAFLKGQPACSINAITRIPTAPGSWPTPLITCSTMARTE